MGKAAARILARAVDRARRLPGTPAEGYFRLSPGAEVRLRYAYIVRCTGVDRDAAGNIVAVHCTYDPQTRSGTPGSEARKVRGNIHWLSVQQALPAEVRLYDRLFKVPYPGGPRQTTTASAPTAHQLVAGAFDEEAEFDDSTERNFLDDINSQGKRVITALAEPALAQAAAEERFQFERHGYFVADVRDSGHGRAVFNRAVTLRDSWGKEASSKA
jgi:glutaminyl-tRNA synthetase